MKRDKETIKQLILTDYLDHRLDEETRQEIDQYISEDKDLQIFVNQARKKTIDPFSAASRITAPARLWEGIEEKLDTMDQAPLVEQVWLRLKRFWPVSRIVWAELSFALAFIMMMTFTWLGREPQVGYNKDSQIEYLMLLTQGPSEFDNNGEAKKTNIEKYFL